MKLENYCILWTYQKNLQNNSIKAQLTSFKNENTENSKTNESHRFRLSLGVKRNLKNPNINIALSNLSIYYTWKNIKSAYNNNKFKISAPTWNDTFDLPDSSYSIADIQNYFEFIIKNHEALTENPPAQSYLNKIENRIVFKIKTGYKLKLYYLQKRLNYQGAQKKVLIKIKMEKMCQNQNLLKLFCLL